MPSCQTNAAKMARMHFAALLDIKRVIDKIKITKIVIKNNNLPA